MEKRNAFTLVELMVVILIVAILAAVALPIIMRRPINAAKWTEGLAGAGTIRTSIQAYIAARGPDHDYSELEGCLCGGPIAEALGFKRSDLRGKYFSQDSYEITSLDVDFTKANCVIVVTPLDVPGAPPGIGTLDENGNWSVSTD